MTFVSSQKNSGIFEVWLHTKNPDAKTALSDS